MSMNFKRLIFNNFGLKVTALFLALFVWVLISGKERSHSERSFDANVEYVNMAKNIDVRSVHPDKVRVTVRGTTKNLSRVTAEDFKIRIDLNNITAATYLSRSAEDYLEAPEGIQLISVYPRMIELTIKEFVTRELPVRIRYKGKLPQGVRLIERKVVPDKVRIFGYKSELDNITLLEGTEMVNLGELTDSRSIRIPLKKEKAILRFEDADTVDVIVNIENPNIKAEEEKTDDDGNAGKEQPKGQ